MKTIIGFLGRVETFAQMQLADDSGKKFVYFIGTNKKKIARLAEFVFIDCPPKEGSSVEMMDYLYQSIEDYKDACDSVRRKRGTIFIVLSTVFRQDVQMLRYICDNDTFIFNQIGEVYNDSSTENEEKPVAVEPEKTPAKRTKKKKDSQ